MAPEPDFSSVRLMARLQQGDPEAPNQLFDEYVGRLTAMVRSRMSEKLAQRVDAEDIVQSVYRSFFLRASEGQFEIRRSGDLWRLLAAIAIHKLGRQIEVHKAGKRNVDRELTIDGDDSAVHGVHLGVMASEPTPEQAAALMDEVQYMMRGWEPDQRRMLEMRLAGYKYEEIARMLNRSERTVRRLFEKVKTYLEQRLAGIVE